MTTKTNTHAFLFTDEEKALSIADNGGWLFVTHDGMAHADDVAACAAWAIGVIPMSARICWVLRTRNQALIEALSGRILAAAEKAGGKLRS
jgi:hypothetical protein